MNLADSLVRSAARYPDHIAVRLDNHTLTYAELDERSARVATLLADRGVRPGDRVAIMLPNIPEFAVVYYGVLRAGGTVVPMNPMRKPREVEYYMRDSGARLLFDEPPALPETPARTVVARRHNDTAVILYTSGTTGQPKGAELTHANLIQNVAVATTELFRLGPDDVVFGGLPLFHSFGQTCGLNAAVSAGACLTLVSRFIPEKVLEVLARDRVTVFEGVPTMYVALLSTGEKIDAGSLRICVSGGAALPVEVLRSFEETFGCVILEGYGLSETSPIASFNHPDRVRKPGSIGTPIRGVQMRLVQPDGTDVPRGEVGAI